MTNTPTKIENIGGQPTWHFWHLEQEYFIYVGVELDEGVPTDTPRKIYLCTPKLDGAIYVPEYVPNISINHWQIDGVNDTDMREGIEQLFLPKVNEYLSSLGGGGGDFPVDGSDLEQYNWIVEKSFNYDNGQVVIYDI